MVRMPGTEADDHLPCSGTPPQPAALASLKVLHVTPEDSRTTEQLRRAGEALEIELLDHIILGQQRYVSLKERGLGF